MKKLLILFVTAILPLSAFAGVSTRTVTGQAAQALYKAMVQADINVSLNKTNDVFSVVVPSLMCNEGYAYADQITRGSCTGAVGAISTSSAVALADALIGAGIDPLAVAQQSRPQAQNMTCTATLLSRDPGVSYSCTLTGEFVN